MVSDGGIKEPTRELARALAIVFGIIAVLVSALLVVAVITLLSRHPLYTIRPAPTSPSTSNPRTGGTNPATSPPARQQAGEGTVAGASYPVGEPPGDIEDDKPPATRPRPLVSLPALPVPTASTPAIPTPSLLP